MGLTPSPDIFQQLLYTGPIFCCLSCIWLILQKPPILWAAEMHLCLIRPHHLITQRWLGIFLRPRRGDENSYLFIFLIINYKCLILHRHTFFAYCANRLCWVYRLTVDIREKPEICPNSRFSVPFWH